MTLLLPCVLMVVWRLLSLRKIFGFWLPQLARARPNARGDSWRVARGPHFTHTQRQNLDDSYHEPLSRTPRFALIRWGAPLKKKKVRRRMPTSYSLTAVEWTCMYTHGRVYVNFFFFVTLLSCGCTAGVL